MRIENQREWDSKLFFQDDLTHSI